MPDKVLTEMSVSQNKSEGHRHFFMDYLNVGANGFAQVGDPDYYSKSTIEMNYLLELLESNFPVPGELKRLNCYFLVKSFLHDFGTYYEIVLFYDDTLIDEWEYSEDESLADFQDKFWDWFHTVEAFDLESKEITEQIRKLYFELLDKAKGETLRLSGHKRRRAKALFLSNNCLWKFI